MQIKSQIIDGKVRQSLRALGTAIPRVGKRRLKSVMQTAKYEASGGWNGGASYSMAAPEKPSYARTGTYGASFSLVESGPVAYTLKSDAVQNGQHYTPFVGGNAAGGGQAWMHVGRWPLIGPTLEKWLNTLVTEIEMELSEILRQEGMGL